MFLILESPSFDVIFQRKFLTLTKNVVITFAIAMLKRSWLLDVLSFVRHSKILGFSHTQVTHISYTCSQSWFTLCAHNCSVISHKTRSLHRFGVLHAQILHQMFPYTYELSNYYVLGNCYSASLMFAKALSP